MDGEVEMDGGAGGWTGSGSGRQELREVAAGELKWQHTLQGPTRLGCQRDTFDSIAGRQQQRQKQHGKQQPTNQSQWEMMHWAKN